MFAADFRNKHTTPMYFANGEGYTMGVNKGYEQLTGIFADAVRGRHLRELEKIFFEPSVTLKVLKHKRSVTISQQLLLKNKKLIVTGNPIFDQEGKMSLIITLVRLLDETSCAYPLAVPDKPKYNVIGDMVISSPVMETVLEKTAKVAWTDANVVITGETGVGKELLARSIHDLSPRSKNPFVIMNMASVPESLVEAELFGYAKGAYTGADPKGRPGLAKAAAGGTLFMDEIGELPLKLQAKILRFLEQKEVIPLGSSRCETVDVRIVCATNKNLLQLVREGKFRQDLYYRLNVFNINIPSLKDRIEDIEALADFFLTKNNQSYNTRKTICPLAMEILCGHDWPGNVRELKNIVERLSVLYTSNIITADQVEKELSSSSIIPKQVSAFSTADLNTAINLFEKEFIKRSIRKYPDVSDCAEAMGVHRTTLIRKMKRYGID